MQDNNTPTMPKLLKKIFNGRIKSGEIIKFSTELDKVIAAKCDIDEKLSITIDKKQMRISLLEYCVISKKNEFAECLVKKGANPNVCNTPNIDTYEAKKAISLETYLRNGGDPNNLFSEGYPPIFMALSFHEEYESIIKLLCESGADLKPKTLLGQQASPLLYALSRNHKKSAVILLYNIIQDPHYPIKDIYDGFEFALKPGYELFLKALLSTDKLDINHRIIEINFSNSAKFIYTPLQYACSINNVEAMRILLEHKANLNYICSMGGNLLHVTVGCGHFEATKFLLEKKVAIIKDKYDRDPLFYAITGNHSIVISLLKSHITAKHLQTAIQFNAFDTAVELCKNGANIYDIITDEISILDKLILQERKDWLEKFLRSGIVIQNTHGYNAFRYVIVAIGHNKDIIKLFLKYFNPLKSDLISPFFSAVCSAVFCGSHHPLDLMIEHFLKNKSNKIINLNNHIQYCLELTEEIMNDTDDRKEINAKLTAIYDKINPKCNTQTSHWNPTLFSPGNPESGISKHKYMKIEHQWSNDDIKKAKAELVRNKQHQEKNAKPIPKEDLTFTAEFTWFENCLTSSDATVFMIERQKNNSAGWNFLWIVKEEILKQDCPEEIFAQFNCKDRYSFVGNNIKTLSNFNYTEVFEINGKEYSCHATHELKISNSEARILLFPIHSDDKKATLYLGLKFLKQGLHKTSDTQCLTKSMNLEKKPKKISLPSNVIRTSRPY